MPNLLFQRLGLAPWLLTARKQVWSLPLTCRARGPLPSFSQLPAPQQLVAAVLSGSSGQLRAAGGRHAEARLWHPAAVGVRALLVAAARRGLPVPQGLVSPRPAWRVFLLATLLQRPRRVSFQSEASMATPRLPRPALAALDWPTADPSCLHCLSADPRPTGTTPGLITTRPCTSCRSTCTHRRPRWW